MPNYPIDPAEVVAAYRETGLRPQETVKTAEAAMNLLRAGIFSGT